MTQNQDNTLVEQLNYAVDSVQEDSKPVDDRSLFRKITDVYFAPKSFEKNGTLYKALGVKQWQKIVMGTVGRAFKAIGMDETAGTYFIGKTPDLESLTTYENGTRFNELIHSPLSVLTAYNTIEHIANGNTSGAIGSGAAFLVNAYCTMLQRYNRERVTKVIDRVKSK